ncbi:NADH-quinone oxidoreductase, E subunit [Hydrogenobacter thermophilus TK-6]|uniref:NADH dehydrogenase I chain E n=1 Tax=Hydrogenobacter thermophilus (strain DSM 6534 / IAM 12695 / TK-6) TaxID=608538 RepID=D3DFI4_HYDTT|nr:NADH-quinone oxidoreductase subunit NuoE [Hydrogenobacter thermophilus]ADO44530.1 NADH-quinone oxidoreductase, E subunit [Hydrogenobacter thermophilus TK-6]BAI68586.1 NADH dehydrogenase I chain E [Hydrogenobacter thermophilus TK-6]
MLEESLLEKLKQHAEYFPKREQAILLCLHEVQNHYGHIPEFALEEVAKILDLPLNHVENVVSFYDMFDRGEPARHRIRVCVSVVCHLMGKDKLIKALRELLNIDFGQVTKDGRFKLLAVQCLGACSEAPFFMVDEDAYKFENKEKLNEVLSRYA